MDTGTSQNMPSMEHMKRVAIHNCWQKMWIFFNFRYSRGHFATIIFLKSQLHERIEHWTLKEWSKIVNVLPVERRIYAENNRIMNLNPEFSQITWFPPQVSSSRSHHGQREAAWNSNGQHFFFIAALSRKNFLYRGFWVTQAKMFMGVDFS